MDVRLELEIRMLVAGEWSGGAGKKAYAWDRRLGGPMGQASKFVDASAIPACREFRSASREAEASSHCVAAELASTIN